MNTYHIQHDDKSDADIIALVQKGDTASFNCIMHRYEKRVFLYVMRFVHTVDEAYDVVQNVFIKALNHSASFDTTKQFSPWIYRIAHNEAITWLNAHNKQRTVSLEEVLDVQYRADLVDTRDDPMDTWLQTELRDEIADALAQLPDHYAQVLRLRYFEDKSYKEMSVILDKPVSSVGTRVRRAKKQLLAILTKDTSCTVDKRRKAKKKV